MLSYAPCTTTATFPAHSSYVLTVAQLHPQHALATLPVRHSYAPHPSRVPSVSQ